MQDFVTYLIWILSHCFASKQLINVIFKVPQNFFMEDLFTIIYPKLTTFHCIYPKLTSYTLVYPTFYSSATKT